MADDLGQALRRLRQDAGLGVRALAGKASVSHGFLVNIEAGRRRLTVDIAKACDRALGTTVLERLVTEGDDVRRRAMLAHLGIVGAGAPAVLAEAIRLGLDSGGAAEPADWDAIVADYGRRLASDPSPAYGASLVADLAQVKGQLDGGRPTVDLLRAGAGLASLYGLWLGNGGSLPDAHRWYGSAIRLADSSGDTTLRAWTRGRSLARGIYEGYAVRPTLDGAARVLALTKAPVPGALEAHAARVHVYALTGDVRAGRQAVQDMYAVAGSMADSAAALARTSFLDAFLECRVGDLAAAEAACEAALRELAGWPLWAAETEVYLGRARAAHGDPHGGVGHALSTVKALRHDVRVIGVAVRDVLSVLPAGFRSDEAQALAGYAHTGLVPWQGLR